MPYENLQQLYPLLSGRPQIVKDGSVKAGVFGDHVVQFASDEDCEFYCAMYDAFPSLIASIEKLEHERLLLGGGMLDRETARRETVERENTELRERIARVEQQLVSEVEIRTKAQRGARGGLVIAQKLAEALRSVDALQAELETLRGQKAATP